MIGPAIMTTTGEARQRIRLDVSGAVQGVGFRPFVHRLAVSEGLGGFVRNTGTGVSLEVEGPRAALERFFARLDAEIVPPAGIDERQTRRLAVRGEQDFVIAPSARAGACSVLVLPDLATCAECRREIFDPGNRRYRYPFTTCVHCGPRYSIIEAVPYDRARTAMRHFHMCAACQAEYDDPASRRFHAEANACADCGPRLALWDASGGTLARGHSALTLAADALRDGVIVALKGLGGFQLLVDARNDAAVRRLRDRKRRPAKPFAIMVPSFAHALMIAEIGAEEAAALADSTAPIVLLRARQDGNPIAPSVAPANPRLGIMLPYTPLHHLLMAELGSPVVATSGNRGGEPIVADETDALARLGGLADLFLVHDRPILRPVDDSVLRIIAGRETVLRRARGYAPLSLPGPAAATPCLALGGHQKNTVAVAAGGKIVLSPHIGDLAAAETRAAFAETVSGMTALYELRPRRVACDAHPAYHSTQFAESLGLPVVRVPHHLAHVLAGMADNGLDGSVLGVAWDGTGYGGDGTIWGGEFLAVERTRYRRVAHLMPFRLPGGEAAMREPRRAALGALYALYGEAALASTELRPVAAFSPAARRVLATMLGRGVNAPLTSSAGRLFDAVAAILGFHQTASFEGEAAMSVEFAAEHAETAEKLPPPDIVADEASALVIDWRRTLAALVQADRDGASAARLAAGFHEALVDAIIAVAARTGIARVLLTGGCFQNGLLTAQTVFRLRQAGFEPYWHHRIPANDGGLAVGQAVFAAQPLIEETGRCALPFRESC
jgi:hydrogenase maturation protein HypF